MGLIIKGECSELFNCSVDNISLHLKHIFSDKELDRDSVTEESSITASDGKHYKVTLKKELIYGLKEY